MKQDRLTEIIERCQSGQSDAFAWLLNEYGARLYSYYYRSCGSAHDAEDLLQDLFVRLLEKIKDYRHDGRFENWLFRVASNLARDNARKKSRISFIGQNRPDQIDKPGTIAAETAGPDERLQQHEQHDRLQQALEKLEPTERDAIILRHFGQLSFKEISEHFEIPIGTALARVHRGLKRLNRIMQDDETKK